MMRLIHPRHRLAVGVLLVVLLAAIIWWCQFSVAKPDVVRQVSDASPVASQPMKSAIEAAPTGAASPALETERSLKRFAADEVTKKLQDGLAHSKNYRAYIHENLSKPEIGGRFYASLAFFKCYKVSFVKLPTSEFVDIARQSAVARVKELQASCDGVSQQFGTLNEFSRLALAKGGIPDSLLSKGGADILGVQNHQSATAQINEAFATNDSHLIALSLQSNMAGLLSEGRLVADEDEKDVTLWLRAAAAVGCELMNNCRDSEQTFISCAASGQCDEDLRVGLRESVPTEMRGSYDRILKKVSAFVGAR